MIKIAICDDEEIDAENVKGKLNEILTAQNILSETQTFLNARDLLVCDDLQTFDLIFLDIDMPEVDGMEVAEKLTNTNIKAEIIFVTNHDELVYKAFRFKALGFVRKKFLEEELNECLVYFLKKFKEDNIIIKLEAISEDVIFNLSRLVYIFSQDHYITLFFDDENDDNHKKILRKNMNSVEEILSQYGFIRVHSRYLVNYKHIKLIEQNNIILSDLQTIPISRNKIKKTKDLFQFYSRPF